MTKLGDESWRAAERAVNSLGLAAGLRDYCFNCGQKIETFLTAGGESLAWLHLDTVRAECKQTLLASPTYMRDR